MVEKVAKATDQTPQSRKGAVGWCNYDRWMNFGRVNNGGVAGFLAGAVSGPVYALSVLLGSGRGDVFDMDVSLGTGLVTGIPVVTLFGLVVAGLPGIFFGMALGASIGDRPMNSPISAAAIGAGAIAGAALLQSLHDADLTAAVAIRGAIVGALSAYLWTFIFDALRRRTPTPILDNRPS